MSTARIPDLTPQEVMEMLAKALRDRLARGKRVHMGRVNGGPRWSYADGLGCHTADGKCVNIAPDLNVDRPAQWAARPVQGILL